MKVAFICIIRISQFITAASAHNLLLTILALYWYEKEIFKIELRKCVPTSIDLLVSVTYECTYL